MSTATTKKLELKVRREVEALLTAGADARAITVRIYGPGGVLGAFAEDRAAREAFTRSDVAIWLKKLLATLRDREIGEFEREVESLSGRMTLVVPKSLHAALKREAVLEGVSLAELLRLKASVPYRKSSARLAGVGAETSRAARRSE